MMSRLRPQTPVSCNNHKSGPDYPDIQNKPLLSMMANQKFLRPVVLTAIKSRTCIVGTVLALINHSSALLMPWN